MVSDVEYPRSAPIRLTRFLLAKSKTKQKPKPKKKPAAPVPKQSSASAQLDDELLDLHASTSSRVPQTLTSSSNTKRKSQPHQLDDDVFASWDTPIPGAPTPTSAPSTNAKRRKKMVMQDSDDEAAPTTGSLAPAHVPNTITQPPASPSGPSYVRSSSPLSSPERSPQSKRKAAPDSTLDPGPAPGPSKKPRKIAGGVLEVVLPGPAGRVEGEKKKAKAKGKGKNKLPPANDDAGAVDGAEGEEDGNAYVPPVLTPVVGTSSSGLRSESSKTKTTPPTSNGGSLVVPKPVDTAPALGQSVTDTPIDVDPAQAEPAPATKKQPKKRAPKAKKGAAISDEVAATEGGEATPAAGKKKAAKGKGKAKAKDEEPVTEVCLTSAVSYNHSLNHYRPLTQTPLRVHRAMLLEQFCQIQKQCPRILVRLPALFLGPPTPPLQTKRLPSNPLGLNPVIALPQRLCLLQWAPRVRCCGLWDGRLLNVRPFFCLSVTFN